MPTPPEGEYGAGEAAPAAAVVPQTVGLHGVVVAFDPAQENWSEYVERTLQRTTSFRQGGSRNHIRSQKVPSVSVWTAVRN